VWGYGVYGANVEIIAITEIYKMSVSVFLYLRDKITQPPISTVLDAVTERTASLLLSGELDNYHYDAVLPAEEEKIRYF
jgi:hypothetical protein